jgi:hypothetical protein
MTDLRQMSNGDHVDLHTTDGQYAYVSNFLADKGASSEVFAMLAALRAEAEKDYADMRRFQQAYIEADQECRHLRAEVERLKATVSECVNSLNINAEIETQRKAALYDDLRAEVERLKDEIQLITAPEEAVGRVVLQVRADLAAAVEVLRGFARQKTYDEMSTDEWQESDFEGAYSIFIDKSRALLARMEVKSNG